MDAVNYFIFYYHRSCYFSLILSVRRSHNFSSSIGSSNSCVRHGALSCVFRARRWASGRISAVGSLSSCAGSARCADVYLACAGRLFALRCLHWIGPRLFAFAISGPLEATAGDVRGQGEGGREAGSLSCLLASMIGCFSSVAYDSGLCGKWFGWRTLADARHTYR